MSTPGVRKKGGLRRRCGDGGLALVVVVVDDEDERQGGQGLDRSFPRGQMSGQGKHRVVERSHLLQTGGTATAGATSDEATVCAKLYTIANATNTQLMYKSNTLSSYSLLVATCMSSIIVVFPLFCYCPKVSDRQAMQRSRVHGKVYFATRLGKLSI